MRRTRLAARSAARVSAETHLDGILAPVEIETFLRDYWESKPLHVRRATPSFFDRVLSLADVSTMITSTEMRQSDLRLVRDGIPLAPSTYTRPLPWADGTVDGVVLTDRVFSEYHAGATIILEALQRKWRPLTRLCRTLETFLCQGVQANVYLTPKNSRGFAAHYDTHDVFVLQVAGTKSWRIYRPLVELPLAGETTLGGDNIKARVGAPLHRLNMQSGDTLYIPRGYIHEAAAGGQASLHITVGVIAVTWAEALSHALATVSAHDIRFRRSLPLHAGRTMDFDRRVTKQFEELLAVLQESTDVRELIEQMLERFVTTRFPILDGHLVDLGALDDLDLQTHVAKRPDLLSILKSDTEGVTLTFHGKKVTFPRHVELALRFIDSAADGVTGASLPGHLDAEGRLVLLRRLIREGYLTTRRSAITPRRRRRR